MAGGVRLLSCAGQSTGHDPAAALVTFRLEDAQGSASRDAAFWPGLDLDATVQAILAHIGPAAGLSDPATFESAEWAEGDQPHVGKPVHP